MGSWIHNQQTNYAKKAYIMKDKEIQTKWEEFVKEYVKYFRSNKEWNQMLETVKKYIDKNKQIPSHHDKDTNVKEMSLWIGNQQMNYAKKANIMKDKEIQTKWDGFVKEYVEYFRSNVEEWNQTLEFVKKYIDENKQRPSKESKDINVKKMGSWISNQQMNYAKKAQIMKNKEIQMKWEGFVKEYVKYSRSNKEWNQMLESVKKYIDENKQRPSNKSKDTNVKKMGSWIYIQQMNYNKKAYIMKNTEIQTKWKGFVKEYDKYFRNNEEWNQMLESVKKYFDENKQRPFMTSKDTNVKKMGIWISNQQMKYTKKIGIMKDKEIQTKWEGFVKEYVEYFRSNVEEWNQMLKSVKKYIDKNKHKPSAQDKDINVKKIGSWTSNQQINYAKKIYIMKDKKIRLKWERFVKEYAEYFRSNEEKWNQMLESVKKYIDKNKQRPPQYDDTKKMGVWIQTQQKNYAKTTCIMKNKEVRLKWEGFVKEYVEYFRSNEEKWNQMLEFVKNYIDDNKRVPSSNSKDTNVKKIGVWVYHQHVSYVKKEDIMKDKEIRSKWESFITTYKEYFPNNIAIKIKPIVVKK